MIHFQNSEPSWTNALPFLPDGSLIKSIGDPGLLMDAKQKWIALGRDPKKLITMYRHFDVYTYPVPNDPQGALNHWTAMYNRWFDGTYRDKYLTFVDLCCESNEYTSDSTWADPISMALALQNVLAAGIAWNDRFRKLTPNTRVCLLAGPVGNWIPDVVLKWAVELDLPVDYHAYTYCINGERAPNEWQECSGLWEQMEQSAGVRPDWVAGEAGPFNSMNGGWRNQHCLAGDETKLVDVTRATVQNTQKTDACLTGRWLGWANYTAGQVGWPDYWLQEPQLVKLANMYQQEYHPGKRIVPPIKEPSMEIDTATVQGLVGQANSIIQTATDMKNTLAKLTPDTYTWKVGDKAVAVADPLPIYATPRGTVLQERKHDTDVLDVTQVDGDYLLVFAAPQMWVLKSDVKPV